IGTTSYGHFTTSIAQLGTAPQDFFVVQLATNERPIHSIAAAIYSDINQAAEACAALQEFSRNVRHDNQTFIFAEDSEGISPLAIVRIIDGDTPKKIDEEFF
ncbi:MAG: hypothetical protein J5497_03000, partial [Selenomonadaceae bacterium]|nr:hypothetical protein [Selenomonadaceae bacterium]